MHAKLLPRSSLIQTGPVDHADWNFRPVLGFIQRRRLSLCLSLIGRRRYERLLAVGFGSGIFLPELATHCRNLFGIDIHPHYGPVEEILRQRGVQVDLRREGLERTSFPDDHFDGVVAISSLEFIEEIEPAVEELHRIMRPGGELLAVMPGNSRILDLGLRLLTGQSAHHDYGGRRELVVPALRRRMPTAREIAYPRILSAALPIYRGIVFRKVT